MGKKNASNVKCFPPITPQLFPSVPYKCSRFRRCRFYGNTLYDTRGEVFRGLPQHSWEESVLKELCGTRAIKLRVANAPSPSHPLDLVKLCPGRSDHNWSTLNSSVNDCETHSISQGGLGHIWPRTQCSASSTASLTGTREGNGHVDYFPPTAQHF